MEIKSCKYRLRCEMGACGKRAEYTICPARVGIRSSIHICASCLGQLVAEGKKLAGEKKAAGGGVTEGAGADRALAAGGEKKFPLRRKSKKAAADGETSEGADGRQVMGGQIMFADEAGAFAEEAPDAEGKQARGGTPPDKSPDSEGNISGNAPLKTQSGLLRCARNDDVEAEGVICDEKPYQE